MRLMLETEMKRIQLIVVALAVIGLGGCASSPSQASKAQAAPYVVDQRGGNSCADCGTVSSVNEREIDGKINVAGAVVGAIIGGVAEQ